MESGKKTTRKGFLQRSALAVAGVFGATALFDGSKASKKSAQSTQASELPAMARINKPKGTVSRKQSA